jgi:hypothetical protein
MFCIVAKIYIVKKANQPKTPQSKQNRSTVARNLRRNLERNQASPLLAVPVVD